jgi:hypothetical protein
MSEHLIPNNGSMQIQHKQHHLYAQLNLYTIQLRIPRQSYNTKYNVETNRALSRVATYFDNGLREGFPTALIENWH